MTLEKTLRRCLWRAVDDLLLHHSNPWELDEAFVAAGFAIGPCEAQDLLGLDVVLAELEETSPSNILFRMVSEGRLGKKTGWGYYRYPGGGGAVVDPLIEDLIREEAHFARITRSEITAEAAVSRVREMFEAAREDLGNSGVTNIEFRNALTRAVHLSTTAFWET